LARVAALERELAESKLPLVPRAEAAALDGDEAGIARALQERLENLAAGSGAAGQAFYSGLRDELGAASV